MNWAHEQRVVRKMPIGVVAGLYDRVIAVVTCNRLGTPTGRGSRRRWGFQRESARIAVRQKPGEALKISRRSSCLWARKREQGPPGAKFNGRFPGPACPGTRPMAMELSDDVGQLNRVGTVAVIDR